MKAFYKLVATVMLFCAMVLGLLVGKSNQHTVFAKDKPFKVALITSEGGLGDRSFNDSGNRGMKLAKKKLGVETKVVEPGDVSEGETYLTKLAQSGYDLVITLDLGHKDSLAKVAKAYPKTHFAIFNTVVKGKNISSVMFKEHEASYLAGALAAMVTKDADLNKSNEDKTISFIGGIDSPGINIFYTGFQSGAQAIDPSIKVLKGYTNSFADPAKGKELAISQINKGSDVVFQAAGATGDGVIQAAKKSNVYAIGVDSDQDGIAKGTVLTSVMKRVDNAVFELIEKGKVGKYPHTMELGLKEKGVQLSEMKYTKDQLKPEYLDKINELKEKIIKGEITVKDTRK
ncbi:BMP family ABC transporter substrate-binding protein [Atopobacter sp. AH10]|uniref:BMP family lipoprotein n=1 Tax=Atopobacter sp. AH10 TaxID=2315861 RepID=UPI000EF23112|nr:BMP family ABC transporter substrate-binding protein [Atopobacter sp. AH10]RLK63517.1 BMP family ABC transporter substrate-binding protein [Atopobacter sp. AH10]